MIFNHTKTRVNVVKSRSSMTRLTKKVLAVVFSVFFFAASFEQTFAATAPNCSALQVSPTLLTPSDTTLHASFNPATGLGGSAEDEEYSIVYSGTNTESGFFNKKSIPQTKDFPFSISDLTSGPQSVYIRSGSQKFCETTIVLEGDHGVIGTPGTGLPPENFDLCQQAGPNRGACEQCLTNKEIWSGVGCIPFSTGTGMVKALISLGLGITGTIVVLMTLYAGFMFSTSQGDPKRVDEAKSAMTSAIIGAFFIIFSVTMLQFIGVSILHLPSFG